MDTVRSRGGDLGPVRITIASEISASTCDYIQVRLDSSADIVVAGAGCTVATEPTLLVGDTAVSTAGTSADAAVLAIEPGENYVPVVGAVSVNFRATNSVRSTQVGTPIVRGAADGIIRVPITGDLDADDVIELQYDTSAQETALVNIRGDSANFDLLTVEGVTSPGEYSATFIAKQPSEVTLNPNDGVLHEQHVIPAGLSGYIDVEGERLSRFYTGFDPRTGALSGSVSGLTTIPDAGDVIYARVARPPIRDGIDADTDPANPTVTFGVGADVSPDGALPTGITVETTSDPAITNGVSAQHGVIAFTIASTYPDLDANTDDKQVNLNRALGSLEFDYRGSHSFTLNVNHWPIQLHGDTENLADADIDAVIDSTSGSENNFQIVLPTTDRDRSITSSQHLQIVSVENDGTKCDLCKVRVGVVAGGPTVQPRATDDAGPRNDGDPEALNSRFSVLGISYFGSERLTIPAFNVPALEGTDTTITRVVPISLDEIPFDINPAADITAYDITVVPNSVSVPTFRNDANTADLDYTLAVANVTLPVPTATPTGAGVVRDDHVRFELTLSGAAVTSTTDGEMLEGKRISGTFDVTYTRRVGALPFNALMPTAMDDTGTADIDEARRPIVAVAPGSRVRITSDNDTLLVDAEGDGPVYGNVSPSQKRRYRQRRPDPFCRHHRQSLRRRKGFY